MRQLIGFILGGYLFFAAGWLPVLGLGSIQLDRVFGGKGAGQGAFGEHIRLHVDAEGNVYVSDTDAKLVQKLDAEGAFLFQIPADPSTDAIFRKPGDICTDDAGNIYVTDYTARYLEETENPRVYMFTPCVYQFNQQGELLNTFYIEDVRVRPKTVLPVKFILDESGQSAFAIQPKEYDRELRIAWSPQGFLYVLDINRATIHKLDREGNDVKQFGRYGAAAGEMDKPADLTVDAQGNVWVADTGNHRVQKFSADGQFILSMGRRGRGTGEFVEPQAIEVTNRGLVLVKDSSQFTRALYTSPIYGPTLSDSTNQSARSYLFAPRTAAFNEPDVATRLRVLEEAEYLRYLDETEGNSTEEDPERKSQRLRHTLYHNVIERIQLFDTDGRYRDRVLFRIDKRSDQEHDLSFLALDASGHVYLRDASDFTILRYRMNGFAMQKSAINAVYSTRAENGDNQFIEDYEDIDSDPDIDDEENLFGWQQRFLLNYDLSERWNLSLRNRTIYNERDNRYVTDPKPEDSYTYADEGWDNVLDFNLRWVTNPNPYRYKELNLYAIRMDGSTNGRSEAILTDRNRQRSEGTGEAQSYVLGLDWDVFRNTNVTLEFINLDPAQTARNYTRSFYDVSGDLYERFRSFNRARVWAAEVTLSF